MRAVGPGGAGVQPGLGTRGRNDLRGYVGLEGAGDGADPGRERWVSGAGHGKAQRPWGSSTGMGPGVGPGGSEWRVAAQMGVMRGCRGGKQGGVAEIRSTKMGRGCW